MLEVNIQGLREKLTLATKMHKKQKILHHEDDFVIPHLLRNPE